MNLVLLISSLLSATIQGVPQISSEIKAIITGITTSVSAIVSSGVVALIMVGVYAAVLKFLNVPEADTALKAIRGIIRR